MALRRWGWLWGSVLAAVVLAIAILPPRVPSDEGLLAALGLFESFADNRPLRDPLADAVRAAVSTQQRRLREAVLADSIQTVARGPRALRSRDGLVTVVYEAPLSGDSAQVWLRAASAELALFPQAVSPGLPVLVALLSNPARSSTQRRYLQFPTLGLQSAASSSGACVVVVNLFTRRLDYWGREQLIAHDASGHPLGRFLDSCVLYGRFGLPGAAVSRWVTQGWNWWARDNQLATRLRDARREIRRDTIERSYQQTFWRGDVPWPQVGCLDGATALCARAVGLGAESERWYYGYWYFARGQLLAYLLVKGTPAQFGAFWRSPLPPKEALEAAYGEPAGQLAMSAFRHWVSAPEPAGPRAGTRVVLAGIAWAGVALALALVAGRRRKTET